MEKDEVLLKDAHRIRKERSKNDVQKAKIESFLKIKFKSDDEYNVFLDTIHAPLSFEKCKNILNDVIVNFLDEGLDLSEIITELKQYIDDYVEKHKKTNGNVVEDKSIPFVASMVEETMEEGMAEIGDLKKVTKIMKDYLDEQHSMRFKSFLKQKLKRKKNKL